MIGVLGYALTSLPPWFKLSPWLFEGHGPEWGELMNDEPALPLAAEASEPARRIFFGLWPSPESAQEIMMLAREAHAHCGGRIMRAETLHLTLAFLGNTPPDKVLELIHAVPTWPAQVGTLELKRFGRFAGPRIVWAGPSESDEQRVAWLDHLHDQLWWRLEAMGWKRPEGVFRPHVSLLRKVEPCAPPALTRPPIVWTPAQCVLVCSTPREGGSHYQVLASMPLEKL